MKQQPSAWGRPHAPAPPRWGRKILSVFLSVVLCLSMLPATVLAEGTQHANHPVCVDGETCTDPNHTSHVNITNWTAWGTGNAMPETSGNYYLTTDVTLSQTWAPKNNTILCLNGYSITGADGQAVISVNNGVTFTLTDCKGTKAEYGKITHTSGAQGHGVQVNGGIFYMYGGNISGNTKSNSSTRGDYGGGVYMQNGGKFTMYDGSISGNTSRLSGSGVYVNYNGTFTMHGGRITGNTSTSSGGGGVFVNGGSSSLHGRFTMTGGEISGNSAYQDGGGVHIDYQGVSTMTGGCITGNSTSNWHGGGVCVGSDGVFTVSGTAKITENVKGGTLTSTGKYTGTTSENVYLYRGRTITIGEEHLSAGASIGVTTENTPSDNSIISIANGANRQDVKYFTSDSDENYYLVFDNGAIALSQTEMHRHAICGDTCTDGGNHQSESWTGITDLSNIATDGGYYYLTSDVTLSATWEPVNGTVLCLNGHSITANGNFDTIVLDNNVAFTLADCATTPGKITHADGKIGRGVFVCGGGTFTMYGGSITENTSGGYNPGGGVYVSNNQSNHSIGKFIMNGGTIAGNAANGTSGNRNGGGVYVTGGEFTMTGGAITGNTANGSGGNGGGVAVCQSGKFTMTGGSIVGNIANGSGGGVLVSQGTFNMENGTIGGTGTNDANTAKNGSGVYVTADSRFTMTNGRIIGNKTASGGSGGGVFVASGTDDVAGGIFEMTGGTIGGTGTGEANHAASSGGGVYMEGGTFTMSGNAGITGNTTYGSGGGVCVSGGSMNVSGAVQITGNVVGSEANNVYLPADKTITIAAGLNDTARIGVTTQSEPTSVSSIKIATGATQDVNYTQIFTPDMTDKNYMVTKKNENNVWNLYLDLHQHSWDYTLSADGKTITASCGCGASGGSVTINAADSTYDGAEKAATLSWNEWIADTVPSSITYKQEGNTLNSAPTNAGTYTASITLGEATASVTYTIAKADPTVTWPSISGTVYVNDVLTDTRLTGGSDTGTFAFAESATKSWTSDGEKTTSVVFTPNSANYNSLTNDNFSVTVVKRTVESVAKPENITNKSYGTEKENLGLPAEITITTSGDKTFTVPVTWSGYKANTLDQQMLTGELNLTAIENEVQQATPPVSARIKVTLQPLTLPEITAQGYEGVYDGNAHGITLSGVPEDATVTYGTSQDACTQDSLTYTGFTNGETTVYYKVSKTGYTDVIGSATVNITKKTVTITAEDKTAYRGATTPELTYTVSGLLEGDTLSTLPTLTAGTDMNTVGEYPITASGASAGVNYDIAYMPGTLTVLRRSSSSGSPTYSVTTPDKTENGTVTISPKNAKQGSTVTITVTPDAGYVLGDLGVTDRNGKDVTLTKKSDTEYTFVMPAGQVEVKAGFVKEDVGQSDFADVKESDYFYDAVRWAVEKGVTNGTDATHFSPDASCTRAQIVTFLWRAAGSPEPKGVSGFVDVAEGSYYAKAVAWAVEQGITNGTDATHFSPDASCTRAQSVTFLYRALGQKTSSQTAFADVPADSYYADAVSWAAEQGITNGTDATHFSPNAVCTRAQIVTFLYRAYQGK